MRTRFAASVLVTVALVASVVSLSGQTLEDIDRRIVDGRTAEARELLLDWWDAGWDDAPRADRERALWLRGRLTLDPGEAASSFRRMVTEFPVGRWTDGALYRLGSLSAASGDTVSATRWFAILQRDFPRTTPAASAAAWLAGERASFDRVRPAPSSPTPSPPPATSAATGDWTIQLGAFAARGRAIGFAEDVRAAGFSSRVVQLEDSALWRVRVGRFADDDDARALYDRIRDAGFDAAIVPGARQERSGG